MPDIKTHVFISDVEFSSLGVRHTCSGSQIEQNCIIYLLTRFIKLPNSINVTLGNVQSFSARKVESRIVEVRRNN